MAKTTTTAFDDLKVKKKERRSIRRYVVAGVLGVLLGLVAVVFFSRVYNPFEESLGERSTLVLAPPDADVVLYLPHAPEVLGKIRDRAFVRALEESRGFQEFLRSDFARKTGALDAVVKAFQEFDRLRARKPLGLDLLGDVSGDALVLAAWAPDAPGKAWDWTAAFRPGSWLVLAAVNAVVDEGVTDLALRTRLDQAGLKVRHTRDSAEVVAKDERPLYVARIRDAVIVGTRGSEVARLKTRIERDRMPDAPDARYAELAADERTAWTEVRALARREIADGQIGFTERLRELWGADDVALLECALPRLSGKDLVLKLRVDDDLSLAMRAPAGPPAADDLAAAYGPFSRAELERTFGADARFFPAGTFAYGRFDVELRRFLATLFRRREVFSRADVSNLADGFAAIPEFGTIDGFVDRLADLCEGGLSFGFFTEEREPTAKSVPGYALVLPLRDEPALRRLVETLRERVRLGGTGGRRSAVKDVVATKSGDADLFELVLPDGFVDDPAVTKLGFAVADGRLVVTNWFPSLRDLGPRLAGRAPSAEGSAALRRGLLGAPEDVRVGWSMDAEALYRWLDQSADAWAIQQTTDTAAKQYQWRRAAEAAALRAGLKPGTLEFNKYADEAYDRAFESEARIRRPEVRRRIGAYLDHFRGLGDNVGLFVGGRGEVEFGVTIELRK